MKGIVMKLKTGLLVSSCVALLGGSLLAMQNQSEMSIKGDHKPIPFIEDAAVPVEHLAEYVTKVHAICQQCGSLANFSYRLKKDDNAILLGEKDAYEPRCRKCYFFGEE